MCISAKDVAEEIQFFESAIVRLVIGHIPKLVAIRELIGKH